MGKIKSTAIVLAAGQGKRMGGAIQKQYMELVGYPVLYYSLKAFENSEVIQDVILVTGAEDVEYCKREIVEKYEFHKVKRIVPGGKERYDSVYQGLQQMDFDVDYVFIHDGARPMVDETIIKNGLEEVIEHQAVVAGMPSKDTIKIVDGHSFAMETPDRTKVWNIQTPQIFSAKLVKSAYEKMLQVEHNYITDDAMVVEEFTDYKVKVYEASYKNIKITTQEDLEIATVFLDRRNK